MATRAACVEPLPAVEHGEAGYVVSIRVTRLADSSAAAGDLLCDVDLRLIADTSALHGAGEVF